MTIKEKLAELEAERIRNKERVLKWKDNDMSDFQEHLAEAMESEAFSKEYVNELTDLLANQRKIIDKYKRQLKDCVNELCYRCGDYKEEHLGRCNGCKWKVVRNGDA